MIHSISTERVRSTWAQPPVREAQIVAVAWQSGGTVVTVPGVGAVVTSTQGVIEALQRQLAALRRNSSLLGTQGMAFLLLGLSVLAYVVEHRYLLVLPEPAIRALYEIHPWLPIVAIDGVLGGSFYLLGRCGIGTGRIRSTSRDRPGHLRRLLSRFT